MTLVSVGTPTSRDFDFKSPTFRRIRLLRCRRDDPGLLPHCQSGINNKCELHPNDVKLNARAELGRTWQSCAC
jgi:hypothetical protein